MKPRFLIAVIGLLLCATGVQAQTKVSGAIKCAKPEVSHQVEVTSGHSVTLDQAKCTPEKDKALVIDGVKEASGVATMVSEAKANKLSYTGYYTDKLENGDTAKYSAHGVATMKDGAPQSFQDWWTLVSGTGKLKGAKGKGTCKGTPAADGAVNWQCEGEITLAGK